MPVMVIEKLPILFITAVKKNWNDSFNYIVKILSFYDTRHDEGSEGSDETIFDDAINSLSIEEKKDFFQKSIMYLK